MLLWHHMHIKTSLAYDLSSPVDVIPFIWFMQKPSLVVFMPQDVLDFGFSYAVGSSTSWFRLNARKHDLII